MANPEHLKILKQGVEAWNKWRSLNRDVRPDLNGAGSLDYAFDNAELEGVNFMYTDLRGARFVGANLRRARLIGANLSDPSPYAWAITPTDLSHADLSGADLLGANLWRAELEGADLSSANLLTAYLHDATLDDAKLRGAKLHWASLKNSSLYGADLSGANLQHADLSGAGLGGANFSMVGMSRTTLADNDLSGVIGLETVMQYGPSSIGIDTLIRSGGKIPESFLRGAGVPDTFITYARSLLEHPLQFYSCFISYSSKDQEFAERLHTDLQAKGVRVWFAPHAMPIGARIRPTIDESIRVYDKLLLVLSAHSVSSQWVEQEVETALRKERQSGSSVLFPVRLDDSVFEIGEGWPALLKDTRHVGDFTCWKDHDSYLKAFDRLLRDLKAEGQSPGRR